MRAANKAGQISIAHRKPVIAVCVFLGGIVLFVFWPTFGAGFLNYDDNDYVYDNPQVTNGVTLDGIRWAFTHFHAANWHPLTTMSHMLDCQLFGLHPWGHHFTNVLLHAIAAILLFLALRALTSTLQRSTLNFWSCAFAAALFAIHPLRVESVAWVAERKDVLSGVFFMLTLLAYANYARAARRSIGKYLLVVIAFALGLMCKPTLVTVPFVLLLLDHWPLQRLPGAGNKERGTNSIAESGKRKDQSPSASQHFSVSDFSRLLLEKVPLFVLSAASSVITILAQRGALAQSVELGLSERMMNGLIAYITYLRQTIFPFRLAAVYPYPQGQLHLTDAALAGVFLLSLTLIFVWQRRKRPFLIVGWFWFLGMLVPMIGIIQVGSQPHADRYTYLPEIGLFCLFTWLAVQWIAISQKHRALYFTAAWVLIAALASRSYSQSGYWRDSETVWEHAIAVTTGNYVAYHNLGDVMVEKGRVDNAIKYYEKAVELRPGYAQAQSNLGNLLLRQGRTDEAISHLEKALRIAEAFNNMGSAYMQKGKIEEAITYYEKAVEMNPNYAEAHNNLGVALLQKGQIDDAIIQYRKAVAIKPDSAELQCNLGNALAGKQDWPGAIGAYNAALSSRPNYGKARNNLAVALEQLGKRDEAFGQLEQNVQLNPNYAEAQYNFGRVLAQHGRIDEAIVHLNEALRLQPDYGAAKRELDNLAATRSR